VGGGGDPVGRSVSPKTGGNSDYSLDSIPLAPPVGGTPLHPSPAPVPTEPELKAIVREVEKAIEAGKRDPDPPKVVPLPDDWRTRGDWLGRYGRYWACLAAICAPDDYIWGAGERHVPYRAFIGRNCTPDDLIRYWVHWLYTTNPRTLELPPVYLDSRVVKGLTTRDRNRRQAEWDDHGEAYPMEQDGPHLYCTIDVPEGTYILSLYDFNKDGHSGPNRWRDYTVSIRPGAYKSAYDIPSLGEDVSRFHQRPEYARARIHQFWGGVWKRFLVRGPRTYCIEINRNYSFNTIASAVTLDDLQLCVYPYVKRSSANINDTDCTETFRCIAYICTLIQKSNNGSAFINRKLLANVSKYYNAHMVANKNINLVGGHLLYVLNNFGLSEYFYEMAGVSYPRLVEKRLKWDKSYSSSGMGRIYVCEHITKLGCNDNE